MLGDADLMAFVPTTDMARAVAFYGGVLGLTATDRNDFATAFDANGVMLRVTAVPELTPQAFTVLGWATDDIEAACDRLAAAGVELRRYQGMAQDARGIWTTPGGDRVAWFGDPDGNTLSLTELARS